MARWRMKDYECSVCSWIGERLVDLNDVEAGVKELCKAMVNGDVCSSELYALDAAPALALVVEGNHDFAERQSTRLARRSNAHFNSKRDVEGTRAEALENQRQQWKREGLLP